MSDKRTTEHRRAWSKKLRDAEYWLKEARKEARSGAYKRSRESVLMVCATLDMACCYEIGGNRK